MLATLVAERKPYSHFRHRTFWRTPETTRRETNRIERPDDLARRLLLMFAGCPFAASFPVFIGLSR